MAEQRAVCAAVPVRALLQLPLLGVNRGYKGLYGGGWPLRGMGAAGTALGAADARTNEHYEIGTILTQFLHCATFFANIFENIDGPAHFHIPEYSREYRCPGRLFLKNIELFFSPLTVVDLYSQDIRKYSRRYNRGVCNLLAGASQNSSFALK